MHPKILHVENTPDDKMETIRYNNKTANVVDCQQPQSNLETHRTQESTPIVAYILNTRHDFVLT